MTLSKKRSDTYYTGRLASDTIDFYILLWMMHKLIFSTDFLHLALCYFYNRKHFVQINTDVSNFFQSLLGVPQ